MSKTEYALRGKVGQRLEDGVRGKEDHTIGTGGRPYGGTRIFATKTGREEVNHLGKRAKDKKGTKGANKGRSAT